MHKCDQDEIAYHYNIVDGRGPDKFDRHLKRLAILAKQNANRNGDRLMMFKANEPLWYPLTNNNYNPFYRPVIDHPHKSRSDLWRVIAEVLR